MNVKWWRNVIMASAITVSLAPTVHAENQPSDVAQARSTSSDRTEPVIFVGPAGKTLVSNQSTTPIGPGVELTSFERFDARGWLNGEIMTINLGNDSISTDLLFPGSVSSAKPLSVMAKEAGAIAGVNGDFFDINNTKAPLGTVVSEGKLVKGPQGGHTLTANVDKNGLGHISTILLDGKVNLPNGEIKLDALNQYGISKDGIGLYTSVWGTAERSQAGSPLYEVIVVDGKVASVSEGAGSGAISENAFVLVGREKGAEVLTALSVGDEVTVEYAPKSDIDVSFAVGGNIKLIENGEVISNLDDTTSAPRTAVGFTEDRKTMILAAIDGRQTDSRGMTFKELAELMKEHGAHYALNLDGGGSTTMVARKTGTDEVKAVNQPSDGIERSVPNGIGIFAKAGSGELKSFAVDTVFESDKSKRVFPGFTRTFIGLGHDENYSPVSVGEMKWQALPADVGAFEEDGVFRAKKAGNAIAQAQVKSSKGSMEISVLGELNRIEASDARLSLEMGQQSRFSVTGFDKDGYSAPIEARDVSLEYDETVISIMENVDGSFTVVPKKDGDSALITITAKDEVAYLPVTIGLATKNVDDFEDIAGWSFTKYPSEVGASMRHVDGRNGKGIELAYDFSTSTATRAAYLQASPTIELPGDVQKIGLWVKGDGNGAWLRTVIEDAGNTRYTLTLADQVNWTGWKYVEATVPEGVRYPVKLWRIYPVETNKNEQYSGQLVFDDVTVKVPTSIDVPEQPKNPDPLIIQNGEIEKGRWRFAVLADSQFVAKSPNSSQVQMARESLRQIVAANPEFLVINGDLVDTAWEEDFELAEQILQEEVGDKLPIYYIPGNHEIMGPGTLDNFLEVYENNRYTFDHKGTRFILLDSSTGSFRTSDFQQLLDLKKALTEAATDPNVKNVVVMAHHPTRDPLPTKNSQLSDRKESNLLEQFLTEFRQTSGRKGALFIGGHAHTVNVERVEGVPYMVVGPSGKAPYGSSDAGGFYEWTMFGVDPNPVPAQAKGPEQSNGRSAVSGTDWIQAEVNPLLLDITLQTPESVKVGETIKIEATGHQKDNLNFPLRYPATVQWEGSDNVLIGSGEELTRAETSGKYTALFNYETGELKALKAGGITLKVEANGMTKAQTVIIE
ncbi:phosphodiester glycosidase family protein [Fredinandcohnia sp. QZ13]|uniref:phosphodiester glycosidase family protein n=1 Tax=Fredinandcohnia sp. QZ13 TaxID=3073144 RepID=UPI00285368E0|nr:phosphodiester glycosidase family protein [Fredinandcohnia sp. QZ13]MDR4886054.1 phosphodiester glycosidase family protein [Fredinandcohnia sp. QZ13]